MIESRLFPTMLLGFNRTFSNLISEHDRANTVERSALPTHPEKPYEKPGNNRLLNTHFGMHLLQVCR